MPILARDNVTPQTVLRAGQADGPAVACWLGQAGFLLRCGELRLAIDPYLSDSLAVKYRGCRFPHVRMVPPPIEPEELAPLDLVFCTHSHTDHMDPGTLGPVARMNRECRFVVPGAVAAEAESRGVPADRLIGAEAGESGAAQSVRWCAIASAHEEVTRDAAGRHLFLGYVLELGRLRIYHSGDCVPYPGLAETLRQQKVDVAILPVNGRDAQRSAAGILGNFTFREAIDLCREAEIPSMLACHFGMFDFNTIDEAWLDAQIERLTGAPLCIRPRIATGYELRASCAAAGASEVESYRQLQETTP